MAVEDAAHEHLAADDFIEQDVPVKGTHDDEKPPRREPRMGERGDGANLGMALDQCTGARDAAR